MEILLADDHALFRDGIQSDLKVMCIPVSQDL
jgi:DNA-binding NarL/FixJ family response regulator